MPNFEKAANGETDAFDVKYDVGSVMHYSSTAFTKNGQKTIEALVSQQEFIIIVNKLATTLITNFRKVEIPLIKAWAREIISAIATLRKLTKCTARNEFIPLIN